MRFRALAFLLSLIVSLTAACDRQSHPTNDAKATPAAAATPDEFAAVRATFARDCQVCHGPDGKGGPVELEDGTKLRVPSLREGHALRHKDSDFVKQITRGGDGMPAFKDKLTEKEIEELISFIRKEFQGGMTPPPESMKSPAKDMKMN